MALPDLETLGRLKPDMLVVIYNDAAYGAEVHHFRPMGIAGRARAVPADRLRRARRGRRLPRRHRAPVDDLEAVREWLAATATARWCWTPKSTPTSVPNGSRRHFVATEP